MLIGRWTLDLGLSASVTLVDTGDTGTIGFGMERGRSCRLERVYGRGSAKYFQLVTLCVWKHSTNIHVQSQTEQLITPRPSRWSAQALTCQHPSPALHGPRLFIGPQGKATSHTYGWLQGTSKTIYKDAQTTPLNARRICVCIYVHRPERTWR